MLKTQFDYLCDAFGDPNLDTSERWKSIKYIFVENPLADVQLLVKRGEIIYIDNDEIGPGFYILGAPNSDLEPINNGYVVTYIPLKIIDKISFISDYVESTNT